METQGTLTGNSDLDSQLDQTATLLYERAPKFNTLEEVEDAMQEGIYGKE
jgi:hypothetical protein